MLTHTTPKSSKEKITKTEKYWKSYLFLYAWTERMYNNSICKILAIIFIAIFSYSIAIFSLEEEQEQRHHHQENSKCHISSSKMFFCAAFDAIVNFECKTFLSNFWLYLCHNEEFKNENCFRNTTKITTE